MDAICSLEACRFRADFRLHSAPRSSDHADLEIEMSLDDAAVPFFRSPPTFISGSDLRKLVQYFERHLVALKSNPDTVSPTFVPQELGFQVQAFEGEVREEDDGELTLSVLAGTGRRAADGERASVGCSGNIEVASLQRFLRSVEDAIGELGLGARGGA